MEIDRKDYKNRTKLGKLIFLAIWLNISLEQMATILEKTLPEVQFLLSFDNDLTDEGAYMLLNLLDYIMGSCSDDTAVMESEWQKVERHPAYEDPPPWETVGLNQYLQHFGIEGLRNSLSWYKKHWGYENRVS